MRAQKLSGVTPNPIGGIVDYKTRVVDLGRSVPQAHGDTTGTWGQNQPPSSAVVVPARFSS